LGTKDDPTIWAFFSLYLLLIQRFSLVLVLLQQAKVALWKVLEKVGT
jgi:hypothetical protein